MAGTLALGGREYRPLLLSNIAHDCWTMSQIRSAGLDQVSMGLDETPEDFARRLVGLIVQTKRIFLLLGGLLIPNDMKDLQWTEELAEQTAAHLQTVTDLEEKKLLMSEIAGLVASFFGDGLTSLTTFRRSLEEEKPRLRQMSEPSGSGSGRPSCGCYADSTSTATSQPASGPSGKPWSRIRSMFGGKH